MEEIERRANNAMMKTKEKKNLTKEPLKILLG
jgi:hypothetical protein